MAVCVRERERERTGKIEGIEIINSHKLEGEQLQKFSYAAAPFLEIKFGEDE